MIAYGHRHCFPFLVTDVRLQRHGYEMTFVRQHVILHQYKVSLSANTAQQCQYSNHTKCIVQS